MGAGRGTRQLVDCRARRAPCSGLHSASRVSRSEISLVPGDDLLQALEAVAGLAVAGHAVALGGEADEAGRDAAEFEGGEELLSLLYRAAVVLLLVEDQGRGDEVGGVHDRREL